MNPIVPSRRRMKTFVVLAAITLADSAIAALPLYYTSGIDLGAAGWRYNSQAREWAVLSLTGGLTATATTASQQNPTVIGDIGVNAGNLSISGNAYLDGNGIVRPAGTLVRSGLAKLQGPGLPANTLSPPDVAMLTQAANDAQAASTYIHNLSTSGNFTPVGWTPSTTINSSTPIELTDNTPGQKIVLKLNDFILSGGGTFTVHGTAQTSLVVDIARFFDLSNGGKVILDGVNPGNVVFNFVPNDVNYALTLTSGGRFSGILLAPFRTVNISGASTLSGTVIAAGVSISGNSHVLKPTYIGAPVTISPVTIASNNANPSWARQGDTVTVSFSASVPIQSPQVTFSGIGGGGNTTVTNPGGNQWTASAIVGGGNAQGPVGFSISATSLDSVAADTVTTTTDGSSVIVDRSPPVLNVPGNHITASATSAAGAQVFFGQPFTDNFDPSPAVTAEPVSGSEFPIGTTTVNAAATDAAGNAAAPASFTVTVESPFSAPHFPGPYSVPVFGSGFTATGFVLGPVTLGFVPAPGQVLNLVNNYGPDPIAGIFTGLPEGSTVTATYDGNSYDFILSYHGAHMAGPDNDITLTAIDPAAATLTIEPGVIMTWACGVLQTSTNGMDWTDVPGATSPYAVSDSEPKAFWQIRNE